MSDPIHHNPYPGLCDLLGLLASAPAPPTLTLWLLHPDEDGNHDLCGRCQDPAEWIAAMPIQGNDGNYEGTYEVSVCSTCVGLLIVNSNELTTDDENPSDPANRERWPLPGA